METTMWIILISGIAACIFGIGQAIGIGWDVGPSDVPVLLVGLTAVVTSLIWLWGYSCSLSGAEETDDNQE